MFNYLLFFHSWFRWIVLGFAVVNFFLLLTTPMTESSKHKQMIWLYDQFFGYQFLIGLTMWLTASPTVKVIFSNWSLVFENNFYFFWGLQHPISMIVALGVWHSYQAKGRRTGLPGIYLKGITISTMLVLSAIPWPWLEYGRNLIRVSL